MNRLVWHFTKKLLTNVSIRISHLVSIDSWCVWIYLILMSRGPLTVTVTAHLKPIHRIPKHNLSHPNKINLIYPRIYALFTKLPKQLVEEFLIF